MISIFGDAVLAEEIDSKERNDIANSSQEEESKEELLLKKL